MDPSLALMIFVGQRSTSWHHMVGGEQKDRNNNGRSKWESTTEEKKNKALLNGYTTLACV